MSPLSYRVSSLRSLVSQWSTQPRFLLQEVTAWLPRPRHDQFATRVWPVLVAEANEVVQDSQEQQQQQQQRRRQKQLKHQQRGCAGPQQGLQENEGQEQQQQQQQQQQGQQRGEDKKSKSKKRKTDKEGGGSVSLNVGVGDLGGGLSAFKPKKAGGTSGVQKRSRAIAGTSH